MPRPVTQKWRFHMDGDIAIVFLKRKEQTRFIPLHAGGDFLPFNKIK